MRMLAVMLLAAVGISGPSVSGKGNSPMNTIEQLRLTARVAGFEIEDGERSVKFRFRLSFTVLNSGSEPAIFLDRDPVIVDRVFTTDPTQRSDEAVLFRLQTPPSFFLASDGLGVRQKLDRPSPPDDYFRIIQPGESWTFESSDWFYVGKESNIEPPSKAWTEICAAGNVWLVETLQFWPRDVEEFRDRKT